MNFRPGVPLKAKSRSRQVNGRHMESPAHGHPKRPMYLRWLTQFYGAQP